MTETAVIDRPAPAAIGRLSRPPTGSLTPA